MLCGHIVGYGNSKNLIAVFLRAILRALQPEQELLCTLNPAVLRPRPLPRTTTPLLWTKAEGGGPTKGIAYFMGRLSAEPRARRNRAALAMILAT